MAKKKKQKSRFVDGIIGILFGMLVGFLANSGLKSLLDEGGFIDNLLDPVGSVMWLLKGEMYLQIVMLAITFGMFVLFMNGSSKKDTGYKDASNHGAYGSAVFSDFEDLREEELIADKKESKYSPKDALKTLEASGGIVLGRVDDELLILPPDSSLDNRNVLVVGSSGSAKGQSFVIPNIINNRNETIIVTDPKGELFHLTADVKRDQGYKVYQIDFLNIEGNGYNPLDYVNDDIQAHKIALSIARNSAKDDKEDHWFSKAKDLLTGLIIYTKSINPKASIPVDVKRAFNKANEDEEFLKNVCEQIGEEHPAFQYLKDASVAKGNERASIFSTFTKQVGIFSSQKVAKLTRQSDFNFNDFQKEKSILYIKIPVKDNPVQPLTATFFDQLHNTFYEIGDKNNARLPIPTISLYDEFANLGKLNDYDNILSTCRGYDWSIMTIIQDFAQLEQKYSKEITRTIVSNHDTTLFLRTKDPETAKFFERLAGQTTINFKTKGQSGSGGFIDLMLGGNTSHSRSTNEQYIAKPLISESELLEMKPRDKCYAFIVGHKVEMTKAFQSVLYKDFITKQDGFRPDGKPNYVYCYPENRKSYIEKFSLKPTIEDVVEEKNESVPVTIDDNKPESVEEPVTVGATVKKEEALQNIVSSFFDSIENKNVVMPDKDIKEDPNVKQAEISSRLVKELANNLQSQKETENEIESDPDELKLFQEISQIGPKIEKTEELVEELESKRDLYKQLDLTDEMEADTPQERDSIDDDLPLG
ncbi:type IV secretory system conjugative DNA transfer family protein [Bacillus firmus]|uniref:VirD4-like conjugal transfer protein, CD1115 family n=1 Tax=Cytobacillus firmus TaxID=1399 RepID=UPI0015811851|nr:type IV secretory system conjugative DNA transfer family protein [Cytobacillus firmus]NUH84742.1 type IV secretory system conjugative DNA transfer family protein [Cytobacillus firmus]